jgi:hypothetical protein
MAIADAMQRALGAPIGVARRAFDGIGRWANVQRVLAIALVANPLVMYVFDEITLGNTSGFRDSISAYYDMEAAPAFYVPLTVAAMLFVVHGVIKEGRWHNWALGIALALVVIFNKDGFWYIHFPAAGLFYAGNAVAIWFTKDPSGYRKRILLGLGGAVLVWWLLFRGSVSTALLIAEWLGLALIAVHFFWDADPGKAYQAPRKKGAPEKEALAAAR